MLKDRILNATRDFLNAKNSSRLLISNFENEIAVCKNFNEYKENKELKELESLINKFKSIL
jgi:hypothetical protein